MTTLNEHDAAALYRVYCDSVGGKAYDGKRLPDWGEFSSDPTKEKQAQAWRDVAHFAFYASEREKSHKLEAERDEAIKDLIKNLQTTGGMPWREWRQQCVEETLRADENLARAHKAEAEVERLHAKNEKLAEDLTRADSLVRQSDLMWRKAEAEVERLREEIKRAASIIAATGREEIANQIIERSILNTNNQPDQPSGERSQESPQ